MMLHNNYFSTLEEIGSHVLAKKKNISIDTDFLFTRKASPNIYSFDLHRDKQCMTPKDSVFHLRIFGEVLLQGERLPASLSKPKVHQFITIPK